MNCSAIFNILQNQFHFINLIYSIYFIWKWRHLRFADMGCFIILHFSSHKMKENFIYLVAVFNPPHIIKFTTTGWAGSSKFQQIFALYHTRMSRSFLFTVWKTTGYPGSLVSAWFPTEVLELSWFSVSTLFTWNKHFLVHLQKYSTCRVSLHT